MAVCHGYDILILQDSPFDEAVNLESIHTFLGQIFGSFQSFVYSALSLNSGFPIPFLFLKFIGVIGKKPERFS